MVGMLIRLRFTISQIAMVYNMVVVLKTKGHPFSLSIKTGVMLK